MPGKKDEARCPYARGTPEDPANLPLPAASLITFILFLHGLVLYVQLKMAGKLTDGTEQVFHGVWLFYVALPVGLLIPYAKIPAAVSLAHGVTLMLGTRSVSRPAIQ
ncbi:hypothetical protein T484DRAFT_1923999 [Baffinella frigidus]|nr:hypothetical protein T484DRAFT_1923999 [Cryptophyta sp. CCMP2293]|mmetsp:Transcript_18671/g.42071  ORF Transcript_18671/g.42071 Transcript_18671/m.42071 type:complete len:107 (+) Transcript_18671:57-377(+)